MVGLWIKVYGKKLEILIKKYKINRLKPKGEIINVKTKTISILLVLFFCSTFAFSQYVEEKIKVKIETEQADSVKTEQTNSQTTTSYKPYVPPLSLKNKTDDDESYPYKSSLTKKVPKMKDFYPVSQIEAYLFYVSEKNPYIKVNGPGFYAVARQNPRLLDKTLTNRKTWGIFGEGGKYKIKLSEYEKEDVNIDVSQIGGGISYAMTRNRPGFNAVVVNTGLYQEVEKGTDGLYSWKQVDVYAKFFGWTDLTRNRQIWFSRTNFSWFWVKPLSVRRSATYDSYQAESQVWDKESIGCEFQQTLLMFYLGNKFGLHFGLSIGYQHLSANQQDWYTPAGFIELYSNDYKVAQFIAGNKILSGDNTVRGSFEIIKGSVDIWQIAKRVFNISF